MRDCQDREGNVFRTAGAGNWTDMIVHIAGGGSYSPNEIMIDAAEA